MDWKEFLKKYGIWIAAGLILIYIIYRSSKGSTSAIRPGNDDLAREELRLRGQQAQAAGNRDIELEKIRAQLEAERLRQQTAQRNAELAAQARNAQTQAGLLNTILGALSKVLGGQSGKSGGGTGPTGGGGTSPQQPRIPGTTSPQPSALPGSNVDSNAMSAALADIFGNSSSVPEPNINYDYFNQSYIPEYPTPNYSSTFENPQTSFDSGYTFTNQAYQESNDAYIQALGASYGIGYSEEPEILPSMEYPSYEQQLMDSYGDQSIYYPSYEDQLAQSYGYDPYGGDYYDYTGGGSEYYNSGSYSGYGGGGSSDIYSDYYYGGDYYEEYGV